MTVYMLQNGADGLVKIGYSANPARRIAALQTGSPGQLTVLRIMDGGQSFEAALHQHFSRLRVRGEWFSYAPEMLRDLEFLRPALDREADIPEPMPPAYRTSEWSRAPLHRKLIAIGLVCAAGGWAALLIVVPLLTWLQG